MKGKGGCARMGAALVFALVLAGCASKTRAPAPVEDRSSGVRAPAVAASESVKPLPGAENAGKPGYYTVRQGDTLIRIALEHGQNWRDVVRWNALDNPNVIETGQVLRVVPPDTVVARPVATPAVSAASMPAVGASAATPASAASAPVAAASAPRGTVTMAMPAPLPAATPDDDVAWGWPAPGNSAVLASADGRVVYAGAGLRGYGNLIILKHNNTYLTAYAHNQTLLVKEDQSVHKGQKIAEMGSSDTDRVKLHFEIRRQGKPVDPAKFLATAK
ncbi:MAG: peptidoglycan DD-metalloendopeptidase family protein [Ramlibacter sp.]